jgi:hypothetical protein
MCAWGGKGKGELRWGCLMGGRGVGKQEGRRMVDDENINALMIRMMRYYRCNQCALFRASLCTTTHWALAPGVENLKGLMEGFKEL